MRRRGFLCLGLMGILPSLGFAQERKPRFADMHAHLGFKLELGLRAQMEKGGMLLVAEKITPDGPMIKRMVGKLGIDREAKPGEMRRNYELGLQRRKARLQQEGLAQVDSVAALDRALLERTPGVIWSAEGADFLEGDLKYMERVRADGLVHVQLVHYYGLSGIGDISTEIPRHKGLTPFGRELVARCNQLGILVDVAHCSNEAMEQVLEASSRPVVYSHGHVTAGLPNAGQNGSLARAVHLPVAKAIAAKGGVIGFWPDWYTYANLTLMADALARAAGELGAAHVGIGSDMHGLVRTVMPSYVEFAALEDELSRRGMKPAEIEGILGGNYLRVLREAMKT